MCDTFVATKSATASGVAIFAKNSDRHPNEGQALKYFPAADYAENARVKCTYIEIPQAPHTHAILLSKPFWMWGAEIGVNEHGLVIGNEAVFSKIPANKNPALIGMDLLRAALERAITPREALQVIIDLLEEFGQGGNCGYDKELYYHNSFIIANHEDAWVLETVGKQWAARQIKTAYSISNCFTLGAQYDMASENLVQLAKQKGLTKSASAFDLAKDYSDFVFTTFGKGRIRRETTFRQMEEQKGNLAAESMMAILRSHKAPNFDPQNGITELDVCMHSGFGPIRGDQSTASMVVYMDKDNPIIFATATSAPCTSIFKPIWMDTARQLDLGVDPAGEYDPASIFWSHEKLHRATTLNYAERIKTYAADRDELEKKFIQGAFDLQNAPVKERADFTAQCFREAAQAEAEWLKRVEKVPARKKFLYSMAWKKFNHRAGME
ncbi:MAG: C69 family dipeptidase [Anaerolineales bacterium]|nr:C69 family dipeptidase [Anaerolineales bacterium]